MSLTEVSHIMLLNFFIVLDVILYLQKKMVSYLAF